jgi:3-hydroxymyristoyl/3-hydroxydecanoyl-(acyl carrier protein) dehydratase/1-acyl-sn-glycerol-3-phosphate acyltransferase
MPAPPLLLADRVLGIEGPMGVLGKGRIVTETDVREDSWYLHDGRMPGGLMIESGQADLLLGSWQGIDRLNRSERIYRLLGCTLTYRGALPRPGETLRYDIRIDQHAKLGGIRMFFFRYDCHVSGEPRLSVKEGQAGFFSDEELANSGGCLWDALEHDPGPGRVDAPVVFPERTDLDRAALEAFAAGDLVTAFGRNFRRANTHTWTPRTPGDRMLILDRARFDLAGGPWKRGYLRAELDIRPDLWFFHGHFHNDPCMPGTLMFDGCLQAMYLLLAAGGHTLEHDGWRFEPLKDMPFKLRCRGQVTPRSKKLVYEVFVTEVVGGPVPRLVAQVLCTVDGLKCFHADPMGVELVPDWPLTRPQFAPWLETAPVEGPAPEYAWPSLLACAWGRPTDAFGPMYASFDGPRKVPRLPGPPYHFISRVTKTEGTKGGQAAGCAAHMAYDVPPDAWYFAEGTSGTMPWAVLLEAALQPCGWLASWAGCAVGPDDFLFRNLDGTTTVHREVRPDSGTLVTVTHLDRVSRSAGMILVTFTVSAKDRHGDVLDMKTTFGFFPPAAFVDQVGVGSTADERERLARPMVAVTIPDGTDGLGGPAGRLRLLDRAGRVDADWYRGEMDVRADDWFFKAHFYRDPVQPGSLGIEALLRLLQVAMVDRGMAAAFPHPRFEAVASGEPMTWKYRGQVVPENGVVQTEVRILDTKAEEGAVLAVAEGHLWVDGKKIYTMPRFAMRIRDDAPRRLLLPVPVDHRPTWTVSATAMMTMVMHALAASGRSALTDAVAHRWLTFPDGQPRQVALGVSPAEGGVSVTLGPAERPYFRAHAPDEAPSVPELPALAEPRADDTAGDTLYASGALFHGPSFQAVERFTRRGTNGATAVLRAGLAPDVRLDGMTHLVPHDGMEAWFAVKPGQAAYPARVRQVVLAGDLPAGTARVEARALALDRGRPVVGLWLYADDTSDTCVAYLCLEEVLLPKGAIGTLPPGDRRAFLQGVAVPGAALSTQGEAGFELSAATMKAIDWLPGTVAALYGTSSPGEIAARDAAAAVLGGHPGAIRRAGLRASRGERPLRTVELVPDASRLATGASADSLSFADPARVATGAVREVDLDAVNAWWRAHLGVGAWPGEAVFAALAARWLADFRVVDPAAMRALRGPALFLANHENYLESVLFTTIASALFDRPLRALAKVEHQSRWLGRLHAAMTSYPGHRDPPRIVWFDQDRPASLRPVLDAAPRNGSLLVHVEGTRQTVTGAPIEKVSSVWADLAVERGWPVVPVAFRGGLCGTRTDLPLGPQVHLVGAPIAAEVLAALPYAERRQRIAAAINALGTDVPAAPAGPPVVDGAGAMIRAVVEEAGALVGADPAWAARVRGLGSNATA